MDVSDLLKFIKIGLHNKWKNLTEKEIDEILSEHIYIKEIHIGNEKKPFIKYALTNIELNNKKGIDLIIWGNDNLQDIEFWNKVVEVIKSFEPKKDASILVMLMHFNNVNDAALFALCWK